MAACYFNESFALLHIENKMYDNNKYQGMNIHSLFPLTC